jgi:hypothetical protein
MRRRRGSMLTVGPRILENYQYLRKIAKCRSEDRLMHYLRTATRDQLLSLVEVASNILSPKFNLTEKHRNKLLPHCKFIRCLARTRSEKGTRRIINQQGSGFALAPLLIPILAEVARSLLQQQ